MSKEKDLKFDFNDILIKPSDLSQISSRKDIDPYYFNGNDVMLPLFTAPMDTVVDVENMDLYYKNKVNVVLPRNTSYDGELTKYCFLSFSLQEMELMYDHSLFGRYGYYENGVLNGKFLIDIANGHMESLHNLVRNIKRDYPMITLMVGNIANPETYVLLSEAGADYIRCGIGNGNGCTTTSNIGVGYPIASLISECYERSLSLDKPAKIVADGGMRSYSDIIKALALGADYVMVGSIFNKTLESSGDNYLFERIKISSKLANRLYNLGFTITKKFRGMSTKEVQKKWGNEKLKTSEGVVKYRPVEYKLEKWVENFEDYLRSGMSYSNAINLDEFIGKANIINITEQAFKRYYK